MSQTDVLPGFYNREIKLVSKKYKTFGIELTFKMLQSANHDLKIELHDDCGRILDIYKECVNEFPLLITPISEQRRIRVVIKEGEKELYQYCFRIPSRYKLSSNDAEDGSSSESVSLSDQNSSAESQNDEAKLKADENVIIEFSENRLINGNLEVDFGSISEEAIKLIDFKR